MNQQMAALYREQTPRQLSHPPVAHSGEELLGLLHSGRPTDFSSMEDGRQRPPPLSLSSSFPPAPLRMQQHDDRLQFNGEDLLGLLHKSSSHQAVHDAPPRNHVSSSWDNRDRYLSAPRPLMRASSNHGPQMMARSPTQQHYNHRDGFDGMARSLPPARSPFNGGGGFEPLTRRDSGSGLSFGNSGPGGSTAVVSPDVTKPNDTIKVQVSLLTEECRLGRVLLIGLFRIGQPTNEKPIFVKQVLFENKIHRQARHWNTRITFRAPRSPGEFEFRIFEELKPRLRDDRDGDFDTAGASSGFYSNATIVRSNRLKVAMDYSHFIEFLRSITEKFRQNRLKRDTGGILSNLLAFMRLIDQIETVFLHGQALLEDFITDLLNLVSIDEQEMSRFPVTDTIPSPIETFHGTIRNVLNSVQANPWIKEFVSHECLQQVDFYQKRLYCAVSGLYFRSEEEKARYWAHHYQFEPLPEPVDTSSSAYTAFIDRALSEWIEKEAGKLIPNADEFRRQRQAIYQVVFNNVIRRLDGVEADLDVFGSSANDFGTAESDMDMCLVLRPDVVGTMTVEDKRRLLSQAISHLESRPDLFKEIDATRLSARIPIVMFKMADSGLECDLCVENVLAQRNTSLLRAYANADDRVRVLAFVLKQFVKRRRMNCAAESTLSSYGYLLMLIHYLQRQDPPVLPVLQTLPPSWGGESSCKCVAGHAPTCPPRAPYCRLTERTEEVAKAQQLPSILARTPGATTTDVADVAQPNSLGGFGTSKSTAGQVETYFYDPYEVPDPADRLAVLRQYGAKNTASVGALLVGFFKYYGLEFDASTSVVSVRMGRELLKSEKKAQHQWKLHSRLSIEDPFEISYDVAHVLKGTRDKYIRQQFVRTYTLLMEAARSGAASDKVDSVMRVVNEPVVELPFHNYKDQSVSMNLSAMASAMAAGEAAAATTASVLGGLFNDAFFDASSLAD